MVDGLPRHRQTTELQKGLSGIGAPPRDTGSRLGVVLWVLLGVAVMAAVGLAWFIAALPGQG